MVSLLRQLANGLYGVSGRVAHHEREHPDEPVVAAGACKMVSSGEDRAVRPGLAWVFAKRTVVLLTPRRLIARGFELDLADVEAASYQTLGRWGSGMVLKIAARDGQHHQLALQWDPAWIEQAHLPLRKEELGLGTYVAAMLLRFGLIAFVVYELCK